MLRLHYWPTPNGWKVTILLAELGLPYELVPVDITRGAQFAPDFLRISPNNRMPAIEDGERTLFESGAILLYLADKHGRFGGGDRWETTQWVMWQMAGLGPMSGQAWHFHHYAPEKVPYALDRYTREVGRLYGVMERRLADRDYLAGEYSVADMACWPWMRSPEKMGQDMAQFPRVEAWRERVGAREAVQRGVAVGRDLVRGAALDDEARRNLFGKR
jgi:GST-like protein